MSKRDLLASLRISSVVTGGVLTANQRISSNKRIEFDGKLAEFNHPSLGVDISDQERQFIIKVNASFSNDPSGYIDTDQSISMGKVWIHNNITMGVIEKIVYAEISFPEAVFQELTHIKSDQFILEAIYDHKNYAADFALIKQADFRINV